MFFAASIASLCVCVPDTLKDVVHKACVDDYVCVCVCACVCVTGSVCMRLWHATTFVRTYILPLRVPLCVFEFFSSFA